MSNVQAASTQTPSPLARPALDRAAARPDQAITNAPTEASSQQRVQRGSDSVQISDSARLAAASDNPRVNDIRAEIATGTYDTDAKLDAALDKMIDSLGF